MKKIVLAAALAAATATTVTPAQAQQGPLNFGTLLRNPIFVAGIIAMAIAVPVAIQNSNSTGSTN